MDLRAKRTIISVLLRSRRPDLANAVAQMTTGTNLRHGGEDLWGKDARLQVYSSGLKIEEYPPGGKIQGQKTRIIEFAWGQTNDESVILIGGMLDQLTKDIQVAPFEKLSALVKLWAEKITGHQAVRESEQRAIDAPNPMEHGKAPPPHQNPEGVHIEFRPAAREVLIRCTEDPKIPEAFTQGSRSYQLALRTYGEWQALGFREILRLWGTLGIKFHDYLAID